MYYGSRIVDVLACRGRDRQPKEIRLMLGPAVLGQTQAYVSFLHGDPVCLVGFRTEAKFRSDRRAKEVRLGGGTDGCGEEATPTKVFIGKRPSQGAGSAICRSRL